MVDYGSDFFGTTDIDPALTIVSGRTGLIHSIIRRLSSTPGSLAEDPTYGYDLMLAIGSAVREFEVEAKVLDQVVAEEGVEDATVNATYDAATSTLHVVIAIVDSEGPFQLTLTVDDLTIEHFAEDG